MPKIGYFPLSSLTSSITGVTSSGSPGPFERKTPSGFIFIISSALVLKGTIVTLQPLALSERIILCFIPQSTATTLNLGFDVLEYQRFLQLTFDTASVGTFVLAIIFMASSQKYFNKNQKDLGEMNAHIEETYSGHNVVQLFNAKKQTAEEFNKINKSFSIS